MAYKYQLGSARLSGSTTFEQKITGLGYISSSVQLQGGSLQLHNGVNISAAGVAQVASVEAGGNVSGSNILGGIGQIADLHFQAGGNLRATDGTVKLGDNSGRNNHRRDPCRLCFSVDKHFGFWLLRKWHRLNRNFV